MRSPHAPRRRRGAVALLAATLTAGTVTAGTLPVALLGSTADLPTAPLPLAAVPAAGTVPVVPAGGVPASGTADEAAVAAASGPVAPGQPVTSGAPAAGAVLTVAQTSPAPAVEPRVAPVVAPSVEPPVADGLTGPAELVLADAPAAEAEPIRVVAQTTDDAGRPDWQVFEADTHEEALAAVEAARDVEDVELVTVDQPVQAFDATRWNDTYRSRQWALDTLQGEAASAVSSGAGVLVAVVDSGVRADHEDLASGTVLPGRNYVADGLGSYGTVDPNGHGTHVAGIIAATRDNARGVAGLSAARILPLRVLGADGSGSSSAIATAIRDAADAGAKVVNLSLGGTSDYYPLTTAVEYARSKGAVVVAAAGNSRQKGNPTNYPAATPGVLTVAASTSSGTTATFSNTGSHIEVAAPGQDIAGLGAASTSSYVMMSGTSMATPYVSAAAAMLLAAEPGLSPDAVQKALVSTATDIAAPGTDVESGAGVIQPLAALQSLATSAPAPAPTEPAPTEPAPTEPSPVNQAPVAGSDSASTSTGTAVTIDVRANDTDPDGDTLTVTAVSRPANGSAAISGGSVRYTPRSRWTGTDAFTYTVSDGRGGTATARVTVTVSATKKNSTPKAAADRATTTQSTPVSVAVLGNDRDADGDRLVVTAVSRGRGGSVRASSDGLVYTPNSRFVGTDSFRYVVSDGRGGSATGRVTVTVTSGNRAPVARADRSTTAKGVAVALPVLGNDTDLDGDALTVTSVGRARGGSASLVDGAVLYTPRATFSGTDRFTYTVSDGKGGTARATATVRVSR